MAWAPPTDDLLDLVGVGQRIDSFSFDLLDDNEDMVDELHPSRSSAPSISLDSTRTIRRQLDGMLLMPDEYDLVSALSCRLRPWMHLQNGAAYPLGIYTLADRSSPKHSWGADRAVQWSDKSQLLDQPLTRSVGWNKGGDIAIAIVALVLQRLTLDDLGDNPTTDITFGAPVAYPPGTSRWKIIEDFAKLLGWLPPFFDRYGKLRFIEAPDYTLSVDPTVSALGPGTRVVRESVLESDTLVRAPNQFVVVESSGRSTIRGVYNVSDAAPQSAANRNGEIVTLVEQVQGLNSTSQANKVAKALAVTHRKSIFRYLSVETTADPRFADWDVVPYRDTTTEAYVNWLDMGWDLTCRSGATMTHKLRRVY
jgi:hypothetical protein